MCCWCFCAGETCTDFADGWHGAHGPPAARLGQASWVQAFLAADHRGSRITTGPASLSRLHRDAIDLYQFHQPDPGVPFEDSLGAREQLREQGDVRALGISNVTVKQIEDAHSILGESLVAVQNRYSAAQRENEEALKLCERIGLVFLPFGPLGGRETTGSGHPAWQVFRTVAHERGVSWRRLAIAWLLHHSPAMLPIPGVSRPASARDSAGADDLQLDSETLSRLHG